MSKKTVAAAPVAANNVLTFRKDHPKDRCSYGVAGVPGIVVFDKKLFANGKAPKTITLNCELAVPQPAEKPAKTKDAAVTA